MKSTMEFRIYWKSVNKMIYFSEPTLTMSTENKYGIFIPSETGGVYMGNGTLMQLVENHPVFGKRFAGDIIEAFRREDNERKNPIRGEVTYLNGCYMALNCTWHELFKYYQSDFKVIGNIYENPELLSDARKLK